MLKLLLHRYFLRYVIEPIKNLFPIDMGSKKSVIFVAGMGRSGTTWVGDLLNYQDHFRVIFEPFCADKVTEAKGFSSTRYIRTQVNSPELVNFARNVLTGQIRSNWTEIKKPGKIYFRRMIKDIRCNLMLLWLNQLCIGMPIVFVVRNPFSVAASWLQLKNFKEASDFDILRNQDRLFIDFPVIANALKMIDINDPFERIIWMWAVNHYVPFSQMDELNFYLAVYENLLLESALYAPCLLEFGCVDYSLEKVQSILGKPSRANFLKRDPSLEKEELFNGWRKVFTAKQLKRGQTILSVFGLASLYDADGYPLVASFQDIKRYL